MTYFLSQEVTDLDSVSTILDDGVDGKMGVDSTHFVEEALSP